jgi:2,4-dienoyl-CoA reductase-like NADH-dependent reductase (Old Yellow Enzyme family)
LSQLFEPLSFSHGPPLKNRFVLAPMTNCQSHADGRLSSDEYRWLTLRAQGGFAATMTCAAHVQAAGQGFPGQLGIFGEQHVEGLTRLAQGIRAAGSLALVQLHHGGQRSPAELIGQAPLGPSSDAQTGARAMEASEVAQLIEDFVQAAQRAERAGFDGVELHGAHGYLLCQFLSPEVNRRTDRYGGSLVNRARIVFEILRGVRERCRPDFNLGLRLSPERYGVRLEEMRSLAQRLLTEGELDYLDLSLWDVDKEPLEEAFQGRSLLSYFTELNRGRVRLGVAGMVARPADAERCLRAGADFVLLGRAAILHHDLPERFRASARFRPRSLPVSRETLRREGLGEAFIDYLSRWPDFVAS